MHHGPTSARMSHVFDHDEPGLDDADTEVDARVEGTRAPVGRFVPSGVDVCDLDADTDLDLSRAAHPTTTPDHSDPRVRRPGRRKSQRTRSYQAPGRAPDEPEWIDLGELLAGDV